MEESGPVTQIERNLYAFRNQHKKKTKTIAFKANYEL